LTRGWGRIVSSGRALLRCISSCIVFEQELELEP